MTEAENARTPAAAAGITITPATTMAIIMRSRRHRARSRLRHDGRSRDQPSIGSTITARPSISARPAAGPNSPPIPDAYLDKTKVKAEQRRKARSTPARCIREIRQVGPGSCPICGMALEPEVASLDTPPNPELADMTRRFWIGLVLSLPAVVLEMGGHLVGGHGWVDQTLSNWIQLVFATPVVIWAGWPFFVRGWQSLVTRNLNMFTLIAVGTGVAYLYSLVGTARARDLPGDLPRPWRRGRGLFRIRRGHHRAGAAGPGAGVARPRGDVRRDQGAAADWRRRPRAASAMTAPTMKSRSTACRSAIICGSGPARRCRSTASFSKAAPRSTNRW